MTDRWTCCWGCGYQHPVAVMVRDHELRCEWNDTNSEAS